jgi:hypothetical protein
MRIKTNLYKRKKIEMDQLTGEVTVLQSTVNTLQNAWDTLKDDIVGFECESNNPIV